VYENKQLAGKLCLAIKNDTELGTPDESFIYLCVAILNELAIKRILHNTEHFQYMVGAVHKNDKAYEQKTGI
jgi:hypothetical protein